jgi:uncharacterized membrane protein
VFFATSANIALSGSKNLDLFLNRAYWLTFSAAFIIWFLIAATILVIILAIVGVVALFGSGAGEAGVGASEIYEGGSKIYKASTFFSNDGIDDEAGNTGLSWLSIFMYVGILALIFVTGVLTSLAASTIRESNNDGTDDLKKAYGDCVIAAVLSLGVFSVFIIGFLIYYILQYNHKKELEKALQSQPTTTIPVTLLPENASTPPISSSMFPDTPKTIPRNAQTKPLPTPPIKIDEIKTIPAKTAQKNGNVRAFQNIADLTTRANNASNVNELITEENIKKARQIYKTFVPKKSP